MPIEHYDTSFKRILAEWANSNLKHEEGEFWEVVAIDTASDRVVFKMYTRDKK